MTAEPQADLANAGGAVALALFDLLVRRGVIGRGDGLAALTDAQRRCAALGDTGAQKVLRDALSHMSRSA